MQLSSPQTQRLLRLFGTEGVPFALITLAANGLNLLTILLLGKFLSATNFGLYAFFGAIMQIITVLFAGLSQRIAYATATREDQGMAQTVRTQTQKTAYMIAGAWLVCAPLFSFVFSAPLVPLIIFSPVFVAGAVLAFDRGTLAGKRLFQKAAMLMLAEAFAKFMLTVVLVTTGLGGHAYAIFPLSLIAAYVVTKKLIHTPSKTAGPAPEPDSAHHIRVFNTFFVFATLAGAASLAFLSIDMLFVKIFFPPDVAGHYAVLAVAGKILFFGSTAMCGFMMPLISQNIKKYGPNSKQSRDTLYLLLATSTAFLAFCALLIFYTGEQFVLEHFGIKAAPIIPLIPRYIMAISGFSISYIFSIFHLAERRFHFPAMAAIAGAMVAFGIVVFHDSLFSVANVLLITSVLYFSATITLHIMASRAEEPKFFNNPLQQLSLFREHAKPHIAHIQAATVRHASAIRKNSVPFLARTQKKALDTAQHYGTIATGFIQKIFQETKPMVQKLSQKIVRDFLPRITAISKRITVTTQRFSHTGIKKSIRGVRVVQQKIAKRRSAL